VLNVASGTVLNFVYPRVAFYNRLDFYGSQKDAALYPVAALLNWNATDVMLSHDASFVYLFFSSTYDFIAKCKLDFSGTELRPGDCTAMSTAVLFPPSNLVFLKGCVRVLGTNLACVYDAGTTDTNVYLVDELSSNATKTFLEGSVSVPGLRAPKSAPAWNAANSTLYYIADINSATEYALRYVTLLSNGTIRSAGYMFQAAGSASPNYHSLAYTNGYLVAADSRRLVSFVGFTRSERDIGETSIKGLAVRGSQLLVLTHSSRMWNLYTHCAPCPPNAFSSAGSTTQGINTCKCKQDYYGLIAR
jgi:hypothetical protein